jgi:hypothetical protein
VALDKHGKPRVVPPLVAESPAELRRQREAKIRRETRLAHREAIREHRAVSEGASSDDASSRDPSHVAPHLRI